LKTGSVRPVWLWTKVWAVLRLATSMLAPRIPSPRSAAKSAARPGPSGSRSARVAL